METPEPAIPLVYVGTPGTTRKAVVHLVEPSSGECRAVLKLPLTHAAKAAIVREADVLAQLTEENYARAPRLLFVDRDRGVATQTFLPGRSGGRAFNTIHRELLNSLMLPGECITLANALMDLTPSLSRAPEHDRAVIDRLLPRLADTTPLPACWLHGDFAPWNIREARQGETPLLDWKMPAEEACLCRMPFISFISKTTSSVKLPKRTAISSPLWQLSSGSRTSSASDSRWPISSRPTS